MEAFRDWYTLGTGHLAWRELELAAGKDAFILEKASWDLEAEKRRTELSALEASLCQRKILLDAHEEEFQARERNLKTALQVAEGKFQAHLASQAEKAQLEKETAVQALFDQHKSKLDVVVAEKDRLTDVILGLEQKLAEKDQQLATASELEQTSRELIATLNRRMTDHDKEVESIKVIHAETTAKLAVPWVTHEQCAGNLRAFQSSVDEGNCLREAAEVARDVGEEARRSLLSTVSHGVKIIDFKMADVKMRPMAISFRSNEENIRSLGFFFQHVICQLDGFHKEQTSKVAREVKELAGNVFKQILSRLYHHAPGVDLRVMGKPIDSPGDKKAAEEAVACHVSRIIKCYSRRDVSSSAGGSSHA